MIEGNAPRGEILPKNDGGSKISVNNSYYTGLYEHPFTKSKPFLRNHEWDTFYLLAEARKKLNIVLD